MLTATLLCVLAGCGLQNNKPLESPEAAETITTEATTELQTAETDTNEPTTELTTEVVSEEQAEESQISETIIIDDNEVASSDEERNKMLEEAKVWIDSFMSKAYNFQGADDGYVDNLKAMFLPLDEFPNRITDKCQILYDYMLNKQMVTQYEDYTIDTFKINGKQDNLTSINIRGVVRYSASGTDIEQGDYYMCVALNIARDDNGGHLMYAFDPDYIFTSKPDVTRKGDSLTDIYYEGDYIDTLH